MTAFEKWKKNIHFEADFWRSWMTEHADQREMRMSPTYEFPEPAQKLLSTPPGGRIKVLDLGSGPLSTIGTCWPEREISLVLVDPLADEFNELLVQHGHPERANIIKGYGEELLAAVPDRDFDLVHSGNALDHAYDPGLCIHNMLSLCKVGGWVYLVVFENEGEFENYRGLHQWNFAFKEGQVILWNPGYRQPLAEIIGAHAGLSVYTDYHGMMKRNALHISIRR